NAQAFDAVFLTDAVDLLLILFKGDHIIGLAGERRSSAGEAAAPPLPQYDKQLLYVAENFKGKGSALKKILTNRRSDVQLKTSRILCPDAAAIPLFRQSGHFIPLPPL
ncbi:MAG: hypothetical protein D3906_05025, partial [Candidatus Electrothrix sp. AUS1_2]|nr:hypothetical protein [Candidatus Electrothrix sp. AUS1_2]